MKSMLSLLLPMLLGVLGGNALAAPAPTKAPAEKTCPVPILSRKAWGAKPPTSSLQPQEIRFITIHHTGSKQNTNKALATKLRGLQEFSQKDSTLADGTPKRAWPDIPYHFYVAADGQVGEGRDLAFAGDTNTDYDPTGHLLIVLEGNFQTEQPTDAQMKAALALTRWHARKYQVPASRIASHKDYTRKTVCPGQNLYARLDEFKGTAAAGDAKAGK